MFMLWLVLFVALSGSQIGYGFPVETSPQTYPHDDINISGVWGGSGLYAAVPALALVMTAVGFILGCTWCYRHKDCKQNNQGTDNQLFSSNTPPVDNDNARQPEAVFLEQTNNNISEDNNNGPISLREMQNIANNNATAYITSENEERNRAVSRESVIEFEPLPAVVGVVDPLERCADWFVAEDFPRNRLQYLREIGRGQFGRIVEGEIESSSNTGNVAVKILNQNASLEDKARFLDKARVYRDVSHQNILRYIASCLQEDPWLHIFELCNMDLQEYLSTNRPKMASLNENGVPLRHQCEVTSALAYLHANMYMYGTLSSRSVLVRGEGEQARCILGHYGDVEVSPEIMAPELRGRNTNTVPSEIWSLGVLLWEVCSWGATPAPPLTEPQLPCPYRAHLYQVMQMCWNSNPEARPTAVQVYTLLNHLYTTHQRPTDNLQENSDFEDRWQRLKPNTIPKIDEHVAIVHAPSTSTASHFTGSEFDSHTVQDSLSIDMDTAVSRSSSILSDKELSVQIKSESLTNLHGSLEDVRNIYLTHNETPILECHQANTIDKEDRSDSSVDPWLKDIIAGSQDDVSYYKDVSDVIKNLDNILNSEKTSSSESSHQASPSRDNLSLDCKKEYPAQSSLVKSPGITNFQNILNTYDDVGNNECTDDDLDRDTIGTLSHSFERCSDTNSQVTLENLTPDTPIKDLCELEKQMEPILRGEVITDNENIDIEDTVKPLKELCLNCVPKVENEVRELASGCKVIKDCETSCNSIRGTDTQKYTPKSDILLSEQNGVENIETYNCVVSKKKEFEEKECLSNINDGVIFEDITKAKKQSHEFIEEERRVALSNEIFNNHCNVNGEEVITEFIVDDSGCQFVVTQDTEAVITEADWDKSEIDTDEVVTGNIVSDTVSAIKFDNVDTQNLGEELTYEDKHSSGEDTLLEAAYDKRHNNQEIFEVTNVATIDVESKEKSFSDSLSQSLDTQSTLPLEKPDIVQNTDVSKKIEECTIPNDLTSETMKADMTACDESTVYMDLINTSSSIKNTNKVDDSIKDILFKSSIEADDVTNHSILMKNDSTIYMDLPSVLNVTHKFLHAEKVLSSQEATDTQYKSALPASTPKSSVCSDEVEPTLNATEVDELSETKTPNLTKTEQKFVADNLSPFDSPTKSQPTDTYDENSSVVLGPFEICSQEYFKLKTASGNTEIDVPKEELLAFSSNFSEINLETPSPLRDGNFLNEVPDIDMEFDDINKISESKSDNECIILLESDIKLNSDKSYGNSEGSRGSPSTPPNSPGNFLASTSQQKYVVETSHRQPECDEFESGMGSFQKEIDLSQIELTAKLAIAENENNLNIEYSGPLTVEGFVSEDTVVLRDIIDAEVPESILAGNGGRDSCNLYEETMQALRNELELKLPLAQVASIEPSDELPSWSAPSAEIVVNYPGALSPIMEETGHQLSAYENDRIWNVSNRTDSSESYLEPCNDSTDQVTDLPTTLPSDRNHSTYTIHSDHSVDCNTYTLQKDPTSCNLTMSVDSLNVMPLKMLKEDNAAVDDQTYVKEVVKEPACDRVSQISPYLVSPTTDTSAPEISDNITGVSTVSKTTVPTDAKASKPSETQCLSKATSIDSWCSNDTLFNVEDNFDDLAMDPDEPSDFPHEAEQHSESSDTLTHHDDEKEHSHCSTYIVHDSKSEACETFSPDSITNCTYTKARVDKVSTGFPESEVNETQTKDLAYGTLASSVPSFSCTTEASLQDDLWRVPQPELVRRSPMHEKSLQTPPKPADKTELVDETPQFDSEPSIKKMESIDVSCLKDNLVDSNESDISANLTMDQNSPHYHYRNMANSVQSTPLTEPTPAENIDAIPMILPNTSKSLEVSGDMPNFLAFVNSAEIRPQDVSSNPDTALLLEGETTSNIREAISPTYSDFMNSVVERAQEINSKSSQNSESVASSSDAFISFENCVRNCPQDLSPLVDVNLMLIHSERKHYDSLSVSSINSTKKSEVSLNCEQRRSPDHLPKIIIHEMSDQMESENEQPHSIIITETLINESLEGNNSNSTYNSHTETENKFNNCTFDSHSSKEKEYNSEVHENAKINGVHENSNSSINHIYELPDNEIELNNVASDVPNGDLDHGTEGDENYATVNFINETFEEYVQNNAEAQKDSYSSQKNEISELNSQKEETVQNGDTEEPTENVQNGEIKMSSVTQNFLSNEKKYCQKDSYLPLLSDIRFTGPASEIMSTSFNQESPTDETGPSEPYQQPNGKQNGAADIIKEWDSDSDESQSSGEFIWKQQHDKAASSGSEAGSCSGSGSGSDGDEMEFVPSSWDCRAEPAKSALRTLDQAQAAQESKKRVVFKRQKYHCVYEYPREVVPFECELASPALPDYSTYADWAASNAEEAEISYGQLYGGHPFDMSYPLRASYGSDYEEDFYISSSAHPFSSLGIMSTSSQFFPGMNLKRPPPPDEEFPPPPSPLPSTLQQTTPSLDFTTPDSGVEDITPGSTEEDFKKKIEPTQTQCWKADSGSSSESVSPSSPGEVLGGLRHTRDKLKLDLPPSPHLPSPRHNRVFNFVLDKPKPRRSSEVPETPLVMTDETPIVTSNLPLDATDMPLSEPTFSTFGKEVRTPEPEKSIVLTDEAEKEEKNQVETVKGEGTVLDSGDEDSGIESSAKTTLERNKQSPNVL